MASHLSVRQVDKFSESFEICLILNIYAWNCRNAQNVCLCEHTHTLCTVFLQLTTKSNTAEFESVEWGIALSGQNPHAIGVAVKAGSDRESDESKAAFEQAVTRRVMRGKLHLSRQ